MFFMLFEVMILVIKLFSYFFKNENVSNNFIVVDMCYFLQNNYCSVVFSFVCGLYIVKLQYIYRFSLSEYMKFFYVFIVSEKNY